MTPGGLYLPLRSSVKGSLRWQALDERGVPEVPRSPSGFALGPIEGVEQPNLITDPGMDLFAATAWDITSLTGSFGEVGPRSRLSVGTGSTAPDVTDTTLDNEVQAASSSGSFTDGSVTYELDTVANEYVASSLVNRVVVMNADRNLTEFGLGQNPGVLTIRELLRDSGGTPITVSLLNGKTIRVIHTLEWRLDAPEAGKTATINIDEYDVGNDLAASTPYDITYGPWASSNDMIVEIFNLIMPSRAGSFGRNVGRFTVTPSYVRFGSSSSTTNVVGSASAPDYVPGSFERWARWTLGVASLNGSYPGYRLSSSSSSSATGGGGMIVIFDSPTTYTKVDTDTLRVGIHITWARG